MNIYKKKVDYRKIYERHHGVKIGRDEFGRSHEIHHIDGNHDNNDPLNLMEVTIQEHFDIHYSQGDYGACFLISVEMNITPEEKSRLASLAANKRVEDGSHPFLGGEIQRETQQRRVDDGSHPFLGPENNAKKVLDGSHNFLGPNSPSQVEWTCPHCHKSGKHSGMYTRWHGNNCKSFVCEEV